MHFLVSALGSAGDVHPFIAISQALRERGHEVEMIALAPFEARVVRAGIGFRRLGTVDDYQQMVARPELWQPRRGGRLLLAQLLRRLPESHAATLAALRPGATVLVGSTLSWGMRLAQEQSGLPGATVHLSPFVLPSATCPPVWPGGIDLSWVPARWLRMLQHAIDRWILDPLITPDLNRLRDDLGLPPVRRVMSHWMHSPDLVIGAWPEWFATRQPDWPKRLVTAGFPRYDEGGAALEPGLQDFLDAGAPPIGITPGSAMAHGQRFFSHALAACESLGQRAVLVSPYREQLPRRLPAGVHHVTWAPFSALLPRLAALIHHGGIGTAAQALAAGVPQLVVPFAHDQFDNAARLARLGVARIQTESTAVTAWTAALRGLLRDPSTVEASRRWARRVADEPPAAEAIAQRLERLGSQRC